MSSIRPLLLTDRDTGGAGNATRRIHEGLQAIDVPSQMLVRQKGTNNTNIIGSSTKIGTILSFIRPFFDRVALWPYDADSEFSLNWLPDRIDRRVNRLSPDVVHMNWVAGEYMSSKTITEFNCPIVWRLPDMWPLTGGCHYADECTRYHEDCGNCPKLDSEHGWDPSRITLRRKRRAVERADVTVVATSSWLASCARESSVFRDCDVEIIPNGLDTGTFRPVDQSTGRELFGLPSDAPLVLFGSIGPLSNPRKGYDLLRDALDQFGPVDGPEPELVVFGTNEPESPPDFGRPTHYTGYLGDEESLAVLYAAADVMVVPSRYEGFGQTVSEAMACGTPVVAFDATGPSDIVVDRETGYLADPYDPADVAAGIEWVLEDETRLERLSEQARSRAVEQYHFTDVARQYRDLYESLV